MRRKVPLICVLIATALVWSSATQINALLSIDQLAAGAEAVVRGVVTSKVCARDPQGRIFTRVEIAVKERWKGSRPVVSIVHAGGVLGEEAAFADGQEEYDVGEEVVTFVRFNNRGDAVTLGMNQGKFSVFKQDGETLVYSAFHGASPPDVSRRSGRKPMRLQELKERVNGGAQ